VAASGQRGAAIKDTDVIETEETALENVPAETVLAIHPPREVQQQFVKRGLEKIQIRLAVQSFFALCKRVELKRIHVPL
jgi:hypothetical protein